jgi:two-component system response regulator FixJ
LANASLTTREAEVLKALLAGETTKSTAGKLGISPKTVETYRARIRAKLRARNTGELVKAALRPGLLIQLNGDAAASAGGAFRGR